MKKYINASELNRDIELGILNNEYEIEFEEINSGISLSNLLSEKSSFFKERTLIITGGSTNLELDSIYLNKILFKNIRGKHTASPEIKLNFHENENTVFKHISLENIESLKKFELQNKGEGAMFIENLIIDGYDSGDCLYLFNNIIFGNLEIKNFTNESLKFEFRNTTINKLRIENSDLGKMKFNGVGIGKLYLENVTLNDCIFNGTDFIDYQLLEITSTSGEINHKQMKDNYRQLKFIMDKNGNISDANKFYELEMNYLLKSLDQEKIKTKNILTYLFDRGDLISSKITLSISKVLNNFGNNWISSLIWLITLAVGGSIIKLYYRDIGKYNVVEVVSQYKDISLPSAVEIFIQIWIFLLIFFLILKAEIWFIKNKPYIFLAILLFGILYTFNIDFISTFFTMLMNPLHGFNYLYGNEFKNIYGLIGFSVYKILYGVILWHLIVAAKRTTKR